MESAMRKIVIFGFSFVLAACAAPRVDVVKPADETLDCKGLEEEIAQARKAEREAGDAKIKSALGFGLIGYLASKDEADKAAEAARVRQGRLEALSRDRGCQASGG